MKKVKKVKINFKALIILLLVIYIIAMILYTFFTMPIKNIYIKNTNLIKDNEIIIAAGIKDYPSIFKLSESNLVKKIKKLDLVSDVKVKKKLNGQLIIEITEAKPLFYNRNNDKVVLSNKKEVSSNAKYLGIPSLINYVPTELLDDFIKAFSKVNTDIIKMINEIEYDPDINEDVVIDDNRFKLRMNDGNMVYVNVLNMARLDNYIDIYASIKAAVGDKKGTLYLDSYLSENNLFTPFENQNNPSSGDDEGEGE